MAYIRGVDVIGQSLMNSLMGIGGAVGQRITNSRSSDLINKLFNPPPTIDPNAGNVPIPGTPGSIPIPSVTPGPSPFAPQNAADMASLAKMDPTGFQSAVQGYQANQGSEFNLTPGAVRFREKPPWAGGGIAPIAAAPQKESSTTNEHLTKQIDPADQPFKEGGTGKLVQYEYQATSDPTTGLTSYMHRAGYDSAKGKTDPAYEKSQRVIADTKDFTPSGGAGKPTFQKVTGPMGQITHWVDPASGRVVTPQDLGITTEAPLSSSTKTMVESAPKVKDFVAKIGPQIDKVASELGPAAGRWTEFMAGKVGADNPEYTKLRTNIGLLSTLLMRMHVGARGGEYIMKHFEDMINQGKQSPANLKAAIGQINDYADQVLQEGKSGVNTTTADPLGIR